MLDKSGIFSSRGYTYTYVVLHHLYMGENSVSLVQLLASMDELRPAGKIKRQEGNAQAVEAGTDILGRV